MIRFLVAALVLGQGFGAAAAAEGAGRAWPSERQRGTASPVPPCTCRGPAVEVEVGRQACLTTEGGGRLARCVMVGNNTSWSLESEACTPPLIN